MRKTVLLMLVLAASVLSLGQSYSPRKGETDVKMNIEGRGEIVIQLFTDKAPKATSRIINLVEDGFYDGLRFHRVERTPRPFIAMIGDPDSKSKSLDDASMGQGGTGEKIPYENTGNSHVEGAVSLASMPGTKTGDSQFFFVLDTSRFLDGKHTVFGKVVSGLDVMRNIQKGDRVSSITVLRG